MEEPELELDLLRKRGSHFYGAGGARARAKTFFWFFLVCYQINGSVFLYLEKQK